MEELEGARVVVTGASGFLGKAVVKQLTEAGAIVFQVQRQTGYDLTNQADAFRCVINYRPQIIVHLAARVGGIIANMANPASFYSDNLKMGMNIIEASYIGKAKLVSCGTICSYPKHCDVPFKEEDFWKGFPEETNAPYGIAKKAQLVQMQAYRKQYGLRFAYLTPTNMFGKEDNFDSAMSHVIPAMIKKFSFAKVSNANEVKLLGTGKVTRSFLYVDDCAEAIAIAAAKLDYDDVVNLPGTEEISMSDLAEKIAKISGYQGKIAWDPTMPDGQPRRFISGDRAKKLLGWQPQTGLDEGLKTVIDWYEKNSK